MSLTASRWTAAATASATFSATPCSRALTSAITSPNATNVPMVASISTSTSSFASSAAFPMPSRSRWFMKPWRLRWTGRRTGRRTGNVSAASKFDSRSVLASTLLLALPRRHHVVHDGLDDDDRAHLVDGRVKQQDQQVEPDEREQQGKRGAEHLSLIHISEPTRRT